MIERPNYLEELISFKEKDLIKIVTGIRRCGKSTLFDLYITGSNPKLLSGELATLLSGRYVEIKMLPLSFKEYISYVGESDIQKNMSII